MGDRRLPIDARACVSRRSQYSRMTLMHLTHFDALSYNFPDLQAFSPCLQVLASSEVECLRISCVSGRHWACMGAKNTVEGINFVQVPEDVVDCLVSVHVGSL